MQRYKGRHYSQKRIVNNILKVYRDTSISAESGWYNEANDLAERLSVQYGVPKLNCCGIIAALSPMRAWGENKRIAELFLASGEVKHTRVFEGKVREILGVESKEEILEILRGNKIKAFFLNIAYPELNNSVTIDRHAISVALGRVAKDSELQGITDAQYNFFKDCYRKAADIEGVLPHEMQALTWVKWRKLKKANAV